MPVVIRVLRTYLQALSRYHTACDVRAQTKSFANPEGPLACHNSTMKIHRNIKIGRKVVRATCDILHQSRRQKVKVKVIRPLNAVTKNQLWRKATARYLCLAHATSYWNNSSSIVFRLKLRNCLVPNKASSREIAALANRLQHYPPTSKNGFQQQLKTGAVFLDLTAAYDTVWHTGLLYKLSKNMPHWFVRLTEVFLRDRRFRVHIGDVTSAWRTQVNGLPQESVLSPTLFNLYTNDLSVTGSQKFIYADDICLTKQISSACNFFQVAVRYF